jgi:hypothetical protein
MAQDINKLFNDLTKAQESILNIVDSLNQLSTSSIAFSGEIAKVVPQNLKVCIDQLLEVAQGQGQSSLSSLMDFLDNIPISEIRKQSLVKTTVNTEGVDRTSTQAQINTQPNLANGPQSAMAESFSLKNYVKDTYGKKSVKQMRESNELSFDAIMDDEDFDIYGETSDEDIGLGINTEFGLDFHNDDILDTYEDFDEEPINNTNELLNDEPIYDEDDDFSEILPNDNVELSDWKDVMKQVHPEDRDFTEILQDDREPI